MLHSILVTGGTSEERFQKALGIKKEKNPSSIIHHPSSIKNDPDFLFLDSENSIGIDQIRKLQKKLSFKPFQSNFKIAFINHAENLTLPAQQALLKNLEEPPAHTIIILSAPNSDLLLPTIISRCQIIVLSQKPLISPNQKSLTTCNLQLATILSAELGERLLLAKPFTKNRETAITFCQNSILSLHQVLHSPRHPEVRFNRTEGPPPKSAQLEDSSPRPKVGTQNDRKLNLSTSQTASLLKSLQKSLALLKKNINVKLVMENMVLNW